MPLHVNDLIQHTLNAMQKQIEKRSNAGIPGNERSGLLFTGNIHDAIPRQLFLDTRLSPVDKMAWIMIRLYAQKNEGAIFPTYDELQIQLASPHSELASRETVSRALLMLRLTGWLSLCKRVRDNSGCIRGNIYAQHDEPLSFQDCEVFDPTWLDNVATACQSNNKTIRLTAMKIISDLQTDPTMRHRHSHVAQIEARLSSVQTPQQLARLQKAKNVEKENRTQITELSSNFEPSKNTQQEYPSSDFELGKKTSNINAFRKSNYNVRNTKDLINNTYVLIWPEILKQCISNDDQQMLLPQLTKLPHALGQKILNYTAERFANGEVKKPIAYLLANLKRVRNGEFHLNETNSTFKSEKPIYQTPVSTVGALTHQKPSIQKISDTISQIRETLSGQKITGDDTAIIVQKSIRNKG